MRSPLLAAVSFAMLAFAVACGGGGEAPPAATPSPAAQPTASPSPKPLDAGDLLLPPQEAPENIVPAAGQAQLARVDVLAPERFFAQQLASEAITRQQLRDWGVLSAAIQGYNAPLGLAQPGVNSIVVTAVLLKDANGAAQLLAFPKTVPDRKTVEEAEAAPGRSLLSYEALTAPGIGDESRLIHFVSRKPDDPSAFDTYLLFLRRDRALVMLRVRDEQGALTSDDVMSLGQALDRGIQEALSRAEPSPGPSG